MGYWYANVPARTDCSTLLSGCMAWHAGRIGGGEVQGFPIRVRRYRQFPPLEEDILEKLSGEQPALDRSGAGSNPASRSTRQ